MPHASGHASAAASFSLPFSRQVFLSFFELLATLPRSAQAVPLYLKVAESAQAVDVSSRFSHLPHAFGHALLTLGSSLPFFFLRQYLEYFFFVRSPHVNFFVFLPFFLILSSHFLLSLQAPAAATAAAATIATRRGRIVDGARGGGPARSLGGVSSRETGG